LAAIHCAIDAQLSDFTEGQGQRNLKIAILHQSEDMKNEPVGAQTKDDLQAVLEKAEFGGIAIGRTIYEEIRSQLAINFDLLPYMSDVPFACTIMRQEGRRINLIANSAVRIKPEAIISFASGGAPKSSIYDLVNPYKWFSSAS
jgi:hypothetical protein